MSRMKRAPRGRVTATGVPEWHLEELDRRADAIGESRAEVIRRAIAAYVDDDGPDPDAPDDERLALALRVLDDLADPRARRVPTDDAISAIAEKARVPKGDVKRRVLRPLEAEGYIRPRWGTIYVHE